MSAACLLLVLGAIWWLQTPKPLAPLPEPSLKSLAQDKGIELGNFAIRSLIHEPRYGTILSSQFDLALADNTPNWYFTDGGLRPSQFEYSFTHMDEVVEWAESHDMAIQAHHYVWGEEKWLPDWLKQGDFSDEETMKLMEEHIATVGAKYSGRIKQWTVVNEAFSRGEHIYGLRDWWADNTGGSTAYIDRAFYAARRADPHSALILNDFNNESANSISDAMYDYIKSAKQRGVPIDGLGMQMHIDGSNPPSRQDVIANMQRFAKLGVDIYVTEFDVNMNDLDASAELKDAAQGVIYHDMMRACIESGVCQSFAILGITDDETWYTHMGLPDPRPLPFDKDYRPKPAFYSLRAALEQ